MKQGYHEIKEHGKREFPFNIYPCSIPVDFTHVALHWHEEMEIIAVKKGNGRITVDTVSYPVSEGVGHLLHLALDHQDIVDGTADMENNTLYNVTVKVSPEYDLLTGPCRKDRQKSRF